MLCREAEPAAALGHDLGEWTQTAAPSCTAAGEKTRSCSRCDYTETEAIAALGHDWGTPGCVWTEAVGVWSCTATAVCSRDASHVLTETAVGSYGVETPATHQQAGVCVLTSSFNDQHFTTQTKNVEIPQLIAVWVDVYVIDDNNGENMNCYVWKDGTGAEAAGWPGEAMTRQGVDKDGHPYYKITVNADAYDRLIVNGGSQQTADLNYVSDLNGRTYVIYRMLTNWSNIELPEDIFPDDDQHKTVTAPDCTHDGSVTWAGLLTNASVTTPGASALGHDWGDWAVTTAATCTAKGVETRECGRCHETETRELAALGHDLVHHDAKAPTCTESGWSAYETCSRCD